MLKIRDRDILEHIIGYCDEINQLAAEFGGTLEILNANLAYKRSVSMCVFQIGELTIHLTMEFKNQHSQVHWKEIRDLRNIAAHHYQKLSMERLHVVITNKIPALREFCKKVLDENP